MLVGLLPGIYCKITAAVHELFNFFKKIFNLIFMTTIQSQHTSKIKSRSYMLKSWLPVPLMIAKSIEKPVSEI
jgi:hypothetical protein